MRPMASANPATSPGATSSTSDVRLAISRCAGMSDSTTRHRHTIASSTATGSPSTVEAETNRSAQCRVSWTSSRGTRPVKKTPPSPGSLRASSSRLGRSSPSPTMTSWSSGRAARLKAATTVAGSLIPISRPTDTTSPARPVGGAGTTSPSRTWSIRSTSTPLGTTSSRRTSHRSVRGREAAEASPHATNTGNRPATTYRNKRLRSRTFGHEVCRVNTRSRRDRRENR